MLRPITGKTLIEWGYEQGQWFSWAIRDANNLRAEGADEAAIKSYLDKMKPGPALMLKASGTLPFYLNLKEDHPEERDNIGKVVDHMTELMRVPTVVAGAVMPDACPAGYAPGTIPVGGVIAAKNAIHPGMHSSDICCSMAVSVFENIEPKAVIDTGMKVTYFGGGGRPYSHDMQISRDLLGQFEGNQYLTNLTEAAARHFGSQGDGNHFFFVGRLKSDGRIALVTHHGSRKPGAMLYKLGMNVAEGFRRKLSPETPKHNAWIPADTREGETYWNALQIIRTWTKKNHFAIHDAVAKQLGIKVQDRFWNEHNFVFQKPDGLFYHAKGATPAFPFWAGDASGFTLIPMNMSEPILVTRGLNADNGLGFSPHGAGRYVSRTKFMKRFGGMTEEEVVREQTKGIDARFFCGNPDVSELPGAYKDAGIVRKQIKEYGLAEITDEIVPYGSIMAGDWQRDMDWRAQKKKKKEEKRGVSAVMRRDRRRADREAIDDGLEEWEKDIT